MKKLFLAVAMVVGLAAHTFGFATAIQLVKGGDMIVFTSNVEYADVYLNDQPIGRCNGSAFLYKVSRDGQPKIFTFKKSGYKDVQIKLTTTFDNMFWGNLLAGGLLGSSTDSWFTSNTQEYSPNQFFVQLEKQ